MTDYVNIGEPSIPNTFWNLPFDIFAALLTPPVSYYAGVAVVAVILFYIYVKVASKRPE